MKQNPADTALRKRMVPGALSRDGFLGNDARDIAEIIAADRAELEAADVTVAEIADMLDALHRAADDALETPCPVCGGTLSVRMTEVMGRIPCPFACGAALHKGVVEVSCPERRVIRFTPLHAHLIREHGFFQGRGAAFRLEPRDAIALLQLYRNSRA